VKVKKNSLYSNLGLKYLVTFLFDMFFKQLESYYSFWKKKMRKIPFYFVIKIA